MYKQWLLIGIIFIVPTILHGQEMKGRVFDATNQLPLHGANVQWKNSEEGTSTDESGYFELKNVRDTLTVSFVGYKTKHLIVSGSSSFYRIGLEVEENILSDVVITAFNMDSRKADIPASVGVISKQDLQRDNQTTIVPSINRIPGVFMQSGAYNTN
jgi:iron complex outermembrane receptor protein